MKEKLIFLGVASTDEKTGCLISRRMVRDEKIRTIRSECGKKGGNPALIKDNLVEDLLNQNPNQNPDIDIENETAVKCLTKKEGWKIKKQEAFEKRFESYPGKKDGKKESNGHWNASIKNPEDIKTYDLSIENYKEDVRTERNRGFPTLNFKHAKTWFNNWRDWIPVEYPDYIEGPHEPPEPPKPRVLGNPVLEKFWNDALVKIKSQVEPETYKTWFEPTFPQRLSNGILTIAVLISSGFLILAFQCPFDSFLPSFFPG